MKFQHKVLIIGGIAGTLIGLAAAFLYLKANEERIAAVQAGKAEKVGKITPAEGISIGISIVNLLRQVVTLGQK